MPVAKPALEEISGYLGVGSLQLLGAFLVADGLTGFYSLVDLYSKSSAFAILFAVPLLVISYVLGLFSSLSVEAGLDRVFKPYLDAQLFATVVVLACEPLTSRYGDVERHSRLLHGCTLAFLLLGFGSLAERSNMQGFGVIGAAGLFFGLAFAALCPLLARRLQREMAAYVSAVVVRRHAA